MSSCIDDMKKCTQNLGWEARRKFYHLEGLFVYERIILKKGRVGVKITLKWLRLRYSHGLLWQGIDPSRSTKGGEFIVQLGEFRLISYDLDLERVTFDSSYSIFTPTTAHI
jgi:hypothetical protein